MIHYHGVPFSGDRATAIRALRGKHAMVSFAEPSQAELIAEVCQSFCIDNGAFSAWKSGKRYNIQQYFEFIEKWNHHPGFDWYVIPDVIDGGLGANRKILATWYKLAGNKLASKGVPVWHLDEPVGYFRELSVAYDRVAIGSSGDYAEIGTNKWWGRMAEAMEIITEDGLPLCKLHGMRMLDPTIFSHFPFSSCDSTNVARNIGIDSRWNSSYAPKTKETRAIIMMERIEHHASASRWNGSGIGAAPNGELFG